MSDRSIYDILTQWLSQHHYDGLYNAELHCGCRLDEGIIPMDDCFDIRNCHPGVLVVAPDCEEGCPWHIERRGVKNIHRQVLPEDESTKKSRATTAALCGLVTLARVANITEALTLRLDSYLQRAELLGIVQTSLRSIRRDIIYSKVFIKKNL